jgi:hypothetical protein
LKVLKLSAQGLPQSWISLEEAVLHYAADEVRWEMGAEIAVFHGGHNAITGRQSVINVNSIIGTQGVPRINPFDLRPTLTNSKLFARDRNVCAYCGEHFVEEELTREHIVPLGQNGRDLWMNVVTACKLSPPKSLRHHRVSECVRPRRSSSDRFSTRVAHQFGLPVRQVRGASHVRLWLRRGGP